MIVLAFANGDRRALRDLLSSEVYESFDAAIKEREKNEQKTETRFVSIDKAELVGAELRDRTAQLTIRFVSQMISATRDKAATSSTAAPTRLPTSPISGLSPATSPLAIRTGSWLAPEARIKVFLKNSATALCAAIVVLSAFSLGAEAARRHHRSHHHHLPALPAAPPRALPYPQLPLPFEIPGAQYLPLPGPT